MVNDSILFLTKDAQCKAYYPCYGNGYYSGKMPNLDALVAKGTKFNNFITAAPSSNMSYLSMFTMKYPYEREIKTYTYLPCDYDGVTLFDKAKNLGFENHIIWDSSWDPDVMYTRCYGDSVIHSIDGLKQGVGAHFMHEGKLKRNKDIEVATKEMFREVVESIMDSGKKVFLWCHLPHVLNGRISYGDDLDLYDDYIGIFREFFKDDNIFISADHGNMNGLRGKVGYGFHVYEPAINIPLITPRINEIAECDWLVSNIDLFDIIFNRKIKRRDMVISDSAYYAQENRRLCVAYENYRYIYNKIDNTEELYDVKWDPNQNFNMISDIIFDTDRKKTTPACEYIFYPFWDELPAVREKLRGEKNRIWRDINKRQKFNGKMIDALRKNKMSHAILKKIKFLYLKR